ncbi:hypothetical protein HanXRQr2_Chr01g0008051 [Helianthus annuus]|uniref:Uncharacterized protein n=1 Tax=Helianthus annuus TaxID=4232 RepID=A0A251VKD1_HELAN|nr:hypothetical protein HanXRQr2_Chr01g0008051 [Helianthus annuus]
MIKNIIFLLSLVAPLTVQVFFFTINSILLCFIFGVMKPYYEGETREIDYRSIRISTICDDFLIFFVIDL